MTEKLELAVRGCACAAPPLFFHVRADGAARFSEL